MGHKHIVCMHGLVRFLVPKSLAIYMYFPTATGASCMPDLEGAGPEDAAYATMGRFCA